MIKNTVKTVNIVETVEKVEKMAKRTALKQDTKGIGAQREQQKQRHYIQLGRCANA